MRTNFRVFPKPALWHTLVRKTSLPWHSYSIYPFFLLLCSYKARRPQFTHCTANMWRATVHCSLGQCMAFDGYISDGDELGKVDFLPVCGQRPVLKKLDRVREKGSQWVRSCFSSQSQMTGRPPSQCKHLCLQSHEKKVNCEINSCILVITVAIDLWLLVTEGSNDTISRTDTDKTHFLMLQSFSTTLLHHQQSNSYRLSGYVPNSHIK